MNQENLALKLSDLSPICALRTLVKNLWMILATAAIFMMGASIALQLYFQPAYQASMTYAVTSRVSSYISGRNVAASAEVSAVISELLQTDVLNRKIRESTEELSDFSGTVTAAQAGDSNLITVRVRADSPETAFLAMEALIDVFPTLTNYISKSTVMQVIQNPKVSPAPVNALNTGKLIAMIGMGGAALMCWLLLMSMVISETVQTRRGAKRMLDATILAVVGHEDKNRTLKDKIRRVNRGLQVFAPSTSYVYSEQINAICARLEHEHIAHGYKTFLITGVGENEGKSTIAGNVAAMLALKGKKVALLDADMRRPALHKFFEGAYKSDLPLNVMLEQPYSRENMLKCMVQHPQLGLYMLFSKGVKSRAAELLRSETLGMVLQQLQVFDYVIIDTPPMGFFADTESMADRVDASLLVVRQNTTPAPDINDAVDSLRSSGSKFLGCVLNDMWETPFEHYDYGYGHKYGYGYGYGYGREKKSGRKKKA